MLKARMTGRRASGDSLLMNFFQARQAHRVGILAQLQKTFAQPFHRTHHIGAGLVADHLAQQAAEEFDPATQGLVVLHAGIDERIAH